MKIIDEIKSKYPLVKFDYKIENIEGYDYEFYSLYIEEDCVISIAEGFEPKTGLEINSIFNLVETNIRKHYPESILWK